MRVFILALLVFNSIDLVAILYWRIALKYVRLVVSRQMYCDSGHSVRCTTVQCKLYSVHGPLYKTLSDH